MIYETECSLMKLPFGIYSGFSTKLNRDIYFSISEDYWNRATFAEGTTGEGWYINVEYEGNHNGSYTYMFYPVKNVKLIESFTDKIEGQGRRSLKKLGHLSKEEHIEKVCDW